MNGSVSVRQSSGPRTVADLKAARENNEVARHNAEASKLKADQAKIEANQALIVKEIETKKVVTDLSTLGSLQIMPSQGAASVGQGDSFAQGQLSGVVLALLIAGLFLFAKRL